MTDNENLVAFETAINLMLEAQEQLFNAAELFHKCGIELCDTFSWGDATKERCSFTNAQIYSDNSGIKKFEKLSGTSGYFINDCTTGKEDKSRRYAEYNGLKFVQLMHAK